MSGYAPIILFVFNRPEHTERTLLALAANPLASESNLVVFSDASRTEAEAFAVHEVRNVVRAASGFKSVTVVERNANYGLAKNIVEGVSDVCDRYGRVIVLEDDLVTEPEFLTFMNDALDRYASESSVWHISGWNYPMHIHGLESVYLWRIMNCWGWATWADRWQHFRRAPEEIVHRWGLSERKRFNVGGSYPFFSQVIANYTGDKRTWAVFWYASIFKNNGLCLTPARSLVRNIGADGSGTHVIEGRMKAAVNDQASSKLRPGTGLERLDFPTDINESSEAVRRMQDLHLTNSSWVERAKTTLATYLPGKITVSIHRLFSRRKTH